MEKRPDALSSYMLTHADLASITDPERAFSTMRLLPAWEDIPDEFKSGNIYTELAEAIFYDRLLPEGEIELLPGFEDSADALNTCVRAHLLSFGPRHEHKIAGVGYMISKVCVMNRSSESTVD